MDVTGPAEQLSLASRALVTALEEVPELHELYPVVDALTTTLRDVAHVYGNIQGWFGNVENQERLGEGPPLDPSLEAALHALHIATGAARTASDAAVQLSNEYLKIHRY